MNIIEIDIVYVVYLVNRYRLTSFVMFVRCPIVIEIEYWYTYVRQYSDKGIGIGNILHL